VKTIAFFNSRSGVGKSVLTYHLAWMFHHLGMRVAVADLDPQAHLTAALIDEERSEDCSVAQPRKTILGAIEAASQSARFMIPHIEEVNGIELVPGDVGLAGWEDPFAYAWRDCLDDDPRIATPALLLTTAIHNIAELVRSERNADVLLLDLGSSLGAIQRAALVAADAIVVPVAPDTPSRLALSVVGRAIDDWRTQWDIRRTICDARGMSAPAGRFTPMGYVVLEQAANPRRGGFGLYTLHAASLARAFHVEVLRDEPPADADPMCLAWLRHLRGLLNLHVEARKPVFDLKAADGAIGSYAAAVVDARAAFENLAREMGKRAGIAVAERD